MNQNQIDRLRNEWISLLEYNNDSAVIRREEIPQELIYAGDIALPLLQEIVIRDVSFEYGVVRNSIKALIILRSPASIITILNKLLNELGTYGVKIQPFFKMSFEFTQKVNVSTNSSPVSSNSNSLLFLSAV